MTFGATVTGAVSGQIWSAWLHVLGKVFRREIIGYIIEIYRLY